MAIVIAIGFMLCFLAACTAWDALRQLWAAPPRLPASALLPLDRRYGLNELVDFTAKWASTTPGTAAPATVRGRRPTAAAPHIEVHNHLGAPAKVGAVVDHRPIYFAPGEPERFAEFAGQEHVIEKLELQVRGLKPGEYMIRPQLFRGPAGLGKTLLAKVLAHELQLNAQAHGRPVGEFIEVWPESFEDLDDVMQVAFDHPGSTLFIDEVHMLSKEDATRLYEFLNNNRYQFKGHTQATAFPETQVLAATTDAGQMPAAFKRRFEGHDLRPNTAVELGTIIANRVEQPADPKALLLLVERTWHSGAPWEGLALLKLAEMSARSRNAPCTEVHDVERIFKLEQLDELGLRWLDREVIRALFTQPKDRVVKGGGKEFVCYAASEQNVCTLSQLDRESYRHQVRPRLMARGLLQLRPYYGQSLTDKCVRMYGQLRSESMV